MMRVSDRVPTVGEPSTYIDDLVGSKELVVCCGARGAGKTTTATALGIAAAASGRVSVVVTCRPPTLFATTLGLPRSASEVPLRVDEALFDGASPAQHAGLFVHDLDVEATLAATLSPFAGEAAPALVRHPLFGALKRAAPWLADYALVEAAHAHVASGQYDLVVVDAPPSLERLSFLRAPYAISRLLDEGVWGLFSPRKNAFSRAARDLLEGAFSPAFGPGALAEVGAFLGPLSGGLEALREHAEEVRSALASTDTAFIVVTTSEASSLDEAALVRAELRARELPFTGYVLNRSWAYTRGFVDPEERSFAGAPRASDEATMRKVHQLADIERYLAQRDRTTLARLCMDAESGAAIAIPHVPDAASDPEGLRVLARNLVHLSLPRG